jgi:hypothetical protein
MAIIVEEGKKTNIFKMLIFVLVFALIFLGAYYLFFAPVPLVDVALNSDLRMISDVSKVDFDVSRVTDSPIFRSLKEYVLPSLPTEAGRPNPFEPF